MTNYCSLLSSKHSFMLFNFSLVLSSSAEVLSSCLLFNIYLIILTSFLSSLIACSSLTGQVSLSYSITLCTYTENNLTIAPKGKPLLANKGTKYPNLLHPLLILVIPLSTAPSQAGIVSPR